MKSKDYKSGSKKYIIGTDGYKRNRKTINRINNDYKRKTYKSIMLRMRYDEDEDVLAKLESVESKKDYIVDLIRKDIKASEN